ncbi:MAG TPA: hypothetical protein VFC84_01885 [Desulfosporosinus sp.]|nr:hypothetical protein [Desulfosporosinus sp.]
MQTGLKQKRNALNDETLKMAREMGLNPRSLIKNIPSPSQQWKEPVSTWIREMYQERLDKARQKKERKEISAE